MTMATPVGELALSPTQQPKTPEDHRVEPESRDPRLDHFEILEYEDLSLRQLISILTEPPSSETATRPLWIEVRNSGRSGSIYIAVDSDRNVINFAIPPKSPIYDDWGAFAPPEKALYFFGVTTGFPLDLFINSATQVSIIMPLIEQIYLTEQQLSDTYRRDNGTSPLPGNSGLTLNGRYGAISVLIEAALILPKTKPGDIATEVQTMLEQDFQPLQNIKTVESKIPGTIIAEDEVGILSKTHERNVDSFSTKPGDTLITFTYYERNNQVPLYELMVKTTYGTDLVEIVLVDVFRYDEVGEMHGSKVLKAKHVQICTAAYEQLFSYNGAVAGVTLKNEPRAIHQLMGQDTWSQRYGDYLRTDDIWASFLPGGEVPNAGALVTKIVSHANSLTPKDHAR